MRDGVLEYLGLELGMTPPDATFRVYRSPATLANAARLTQSIPLTHDHVSLDEAPLVPVGRVDTYECIDLLDEATSSTTGVLHQITCDASILGALETGKRELSLGYFSDLQPSSRDGVDFEQTNIIPHHLAVVTNGRCGPVCSFLDKKPSEKPVTEKKKVSTLDETAELNLATIAEMMKQLPELVRSTPIDKLKDLLGPLQDALAAATKATEADVDADGEADKPADSDKPAESPTPSNDSAAVFQDAVAKRVALEVKAATELRDSVVEHATKFVDATYTFKGKSTHQIMRDALTTQYGAQVFSDTELPIAFKMLRHTSNNLKTFGDAKNTAVPQGRLAAAVGDKEI